MEIHNQFREQQAKKVAIIMAGGLGKRMNSVIPKVLNVICGKPMLIHLLGQCLDVCDHIFIVVGKYEEDIKKCVECHIGGEGLQKIEYVMQMYPMGTGHAVKCVKPQIEPWINSYPDIRCIVLSGDVPFLSSRTMKELFIVSGETNTKMVVAHMEQPFGYGRVVCNLLDGKFEKIVEEKDATQEEKNIQLVNCGIYSFHAKSLFENIGSLENKNSQKPTNHKCFG